MNIIVCSIIIIQSISNYTLSIAVPAVKCCMWTYY